MPQIAFVNPARNGDVIRNTVTISLQGSDRQILHVVTDLVECFKRAAQRHLQIGKRGSVARLPLVADHADHPRIISFFVGFLEADIKILDQGKIFLGPLLFFFDCPGGSLRLFFRLLLFLLEAGFFRRFPLAPLFFSAPVGFFLLFFPFFISRSIAQNQVVQIDGDGVVRRLKSGPGRIEFASDIVLEPVVCIGKTPVFLRHHIPRILGHLAPGFENRLGFLLRLFLTAGKFVMFGLGQLVEAFANLAQFFPVFDQGVHRLCGNRHKPSIGPCLNVVFGILVQLIQQERLPGVKFLPYSKVLPGLKLSPGK